jgi:hypothetical protein
MSDNDISLHDKVKRQILLACNSLGFQAKEEYKGKDWRADVFVLGNDTKYAFEVQITQQSLKKTLERQEKYQRDGITGCWLFEKEPARQKEEMPDLPLFKINNIEGQIYISLKERKELPLDIFISDFLQNKIKFCKILDILPRIEIIFVEMYCWKCGLENHIYYMGDFISPCNTKIHHDEAMWDSEKLVFRPEIMDKVNEYANSEKGKILNIGKIKERYSKSVDHSYLSFGCSGCDSIFGDWFIHEAIIEAWYGEGVVDKISFEVNLDLDLRLNVPHWCHPGENKFCE